MKMLFAGRELDAEFHVKGNRRVFQIVLDYKGFGLNAEYSEVQLLLLKRVGELEGRLTGAWLHTSRTIEEPPKEEWKVPLPKSESLRNENRLDIVKTIRKSVSGMARRKRAKGPGNPERTIYLTFRFPHQTTLDDLTNYLRSGALEDNEISEIDVGVGTPDSTDVSTLVARLQDVLNRYDKVSPQAKERLSKSIERGPVGQIMKRLIGHNCQIGSALKVKCETFIGKDNNAFTEAHHVIPVASMEEGALRAENVVVLCPHHHREVHYARTGWIRDEGAWFSFEVSRNMGTVMGTVPKPNLKGLIEQLSLAGDALVSFS